MGTRFKRETPPSSYWAKSADGEVKLIWNSDPNSTTKYHTNDCTVPLFSASELAPTYHDGGINRILGCPHYARSCKFRAKAILLRTEANHFTYFFVTNTCQANSAIQPRESSTLAVSAVNKVVKWQHKTKTLHLIDMK